MDLTLSTAAAARLEWLDSAKSTNDELVARATGALKAQWPGFSVVATDDQTAGRGRLGRVWTAPAGASLAVSLLLRPTAPTVTFGWLPLMAGVAMVRGLQELDPEATGTPVTLKWPNDVRIGDRKVCGILSELLPDATGVVVGAGVNLTLTEDQLPVPSATSLEIEGRSAELDDVLSAYLRHFRVLFDNFELAAGDADLSGLRSEAQRLCSTLGKQVRVELPSDTELTGTAVDIDSSGRLEVLRDGSLHPLAVAAGDVTHLRY